MGRIWRILKKNYKKFNRNLRARYWNYRRKLKGIVGKFLSKKLLIIHYKLSIRELLPSCLICRICIISWNRIIIFCRKKIRLI